MHYLVIVDVQNDFIDGSLGTKEAAAMLPKLLKKAESFDGELILTKDTHLDNFLETQEGKMLPVKHCIRGTEGWQFPEALQKICDERNARVYEKYTFGSMELAEDLKREYKRGEIDYIEFIGLCTDICVITNALLCKTAMTELPIYVDPECCAGVTPEKHEAALDVMRSCQIIVRE
jgi:nicotinamidase/pyrazinamidase